MNQENTGERLVTSVFNETTMEHLHRYAIAKNFAENKQVLDIACGEGYGSNLLADVAAKVLGVDINAETIRDANKKYKKNNLNFLEGSIESIPCENSSIDLVVCFETIEHVFSHDKLMEEIKRVLKPFGILIASTPDKKNYSELESFNNPSHVKEMYKEEFTSLILKYFRHAVFLEQRFINSSLITAEPANELIFYEGDFKKINEQQKIQAIYHISISSEGPIKALPSSIFTSQFTLDMAFRQRLRNSYAYRTGHFILWPFKKLYSVFKKQIP